MKLMFVGESNKGKTSLLMALTKKGKVNYYQDIKLNVNRKPLSTVGVNLGDWEYTKQTSILQAGKKITFMTWDFGGQVSSSLLTCFTSSDYRILTIGRVLCYSSVFHLPTCSIHCGMECSRWNCWTGEFEVVAGEY